MKYIKTQVPYQHRLSSLQIKKVLNFFFFCISNKKRCLILHLNSQVDTTVFLCSLCSVKCIFFFSRFDIKTKPSWFWIGFYFIISIKSRGKGNKYIISHRCWEEFYSENNIRIMMQKLLSHCSHCSFDFKWYCSDTLILKLSAINAGACCMQ